MGGRTGREPESGREKADTPPRSDGPLKLAEALEAWGDPALVAELAHLESQVYTGPQVWNLDLPMRSYGAGARVEHHRRR